MSLSKKISSKKMMIMTVLAIATGSFLLTGAMFATLSYSANAFMQNQNNMMGGGKPMTNNGYQMNGMFNNNLIPQINGTINLKNNTNNQPIKNVSISFLTAAQSAQSAISNSSIIGGHIGVTQGFLTYNFKISNPANNTISKVIVDAGNGKVLYTSPGKSINSTQFAMQGMNDGFGGGQWTQGHWGFGGHGMNDGFRGHWGFGGGQW